MSIEEALGKLRAAQMCHPNAVQALIDEAITAIQQAEAQQPATGEPVGWSDTQIDRLLGAKVPGGSDVLHWFLPYANDRGLSNIRDVVRLMLAAANTRPSPSAAVTGEPVVPDGVWEALQRLIENGFHLGPASADDSLLVARYRKSLLNTHPAPSVPDDVVRDAERLNDLESLVKSKGMHGLSFDYCRHVEDGYVVEKGFRLMWRHTLCERKPTLREAIDAGMLAAKEGGAA